MEACLLSRSSQLMIVSASTASDEPSGPPIRTAAVAAVLLAAGVDISRHVATSWVATSVRQLARARAIFAHCAARTQAPARTAAQHGE